MSGDNDTPGADAGPERPREESPATGRVVVGLDDGAPATAVAAALGEAGMADVHELFDGVLVGTAPVDDAFLDRVSRIAGVRYAERDVLHDI
ncbi:hypothetical protein [Georgenia sp. Marseille-Q6866]